MTLSPFNVYLWGIADNVCSVLHAAVVGGVFISCILLAASLICLDASRAKPETRLVVERYRNRFIAVLIPLAVLFAVTPNSRTVATMVVLPAIVNSEPIQKDLPEIYNMAVEALKDSLRRDKPAAAKAK